MAPDNSKVAYAFGGGGSFTSRVCWQVLTVSELARRPFSQKSRKIQGTENRFTYIYACRVCILVQDFNTFREIVEGTLQFFRFFFGRYGFGSVLKVIGTF